MTRLVLPILMCIATSACAGVVVDAERFGESLGGWSAKGERAAEYELSGSPYRTYRPEVTKSPDGGIFVSVRIDHRRGFLASDDHASLELNFGPDGSLVSAQSKIAIQGRTISSDLIRGSAEAGSEVAPQGVDRAVKIGSDLVADLSSKLLREKIVEPGRVSYPAVIKHNYNLLYDAVLYKKDPRGIPLADVAAAAPVIPPAPQGRGPSVTEIDEKDQRPWPQSPPKLQVEPYGVQPKPPLPPPAKK